MECYRFLEKQKQEKLEKQLMRRNSTMKFGEVFGKVILSTIETVGAVAIATQAERERQTDELVALKNKEAERAYKSNAIIKGDIDNLRNHVAKIVQQEDTPEDIKKKGKDLLKSESTWFGEDTYTCDKYYKFVIDNGL